MAKSNLVPLEVLGVSPEGKVQPAPVVLLRHEDRVLPILVGPFEADAILSALTRREMPRPMTHDLICNILAGLGGEVKSLTIYKIEDRVFFAHLNVEQRSADGEVLQSLRIDTRPSDGIAIACRVECPIYAAEEVMDNEGLEWTALSAGDDDSDDDLEETDPDPDLEA
jgi:bifunctional DNase/RNase